MITDAEVEITEDISVSIEGALIFTFVAYETTALAVNVMARRMVIPPLTDIIGPMTHKRWVNLLTWLFLGFWWDHFYKKGCSPDCRKHNESEVGFGSFRFSRNKAVSSNPAS
jgi:hypothetical protein